MEWLRYEMEGLNHWRIDEKYDSNTSGGLYMNDAFRIQRYYVNGPGQLGQIVKAHIYTYPNNTTNQSSADVDYYYGYDVLGNVSVISGNAGIYDGLEIDQFEQDAFGNQVEGSWSNPAGITEHLTTKQFDADLGPNGLYYFNARWYDPVTSTFLSYDPHRRYDESRYAFCHSLPTLFVDISGLTSAVLDFGDALLGDMNVTCDYDDVSSLIQKDDSPPSHTFTGGLPPGWYDKKQGEWAPKCSKSEAEAEWNSIVASISSSVGGAYKACGSNENLRLIAQQSCDSGKCCWKCTLRIRYKRTWNPTVLFMGSPMRAVHQFVECRLKSTEEDHMGVQGQVRAERPWSDPRNPVLDNWWGSSITPGMSGYDLCQKWPLGP